MNGQIDAIGVSVSEPILSPGHPQHVADLFESGEIIWESGWGDRETHTCAHGALLRPCDTPGDEIMWSAVVSYRGLTMTWNDQQDSVAPIIGGLRGMADPTEDEMVAIWGNHWRECRRVCRELAVATPEQLRAARDARAAWAAWDAWDAWAAWAAWAARDAWDAWAAWDARAAWDAWAARDNIAAEVFARAVAAWESVFPRPAERLS